VQRYLPGTANEAHKGSGSWEDVVVIRDKTAEEMKAAVREALSALDPVVRGQKDRCRAINWNAVREFDAPLGDRVIEDRVKEAPGAPTEPAP
jgi:hypothetical protein